MADARLAEAAKLPPEAPGGLNLEGLGSTPEGHLLIGFRNPVPEGTALIVRLHNPTDLLRGSGRTKLTIAARLDLGGRGIRAIEFIPESRAYVLIAGAFDDARNFRLYKWAGGTSDSAVPIETNALQDINPEELITTSRQGNTQTFNVFSDDGDLLMGDKKCKEVKDDAKRAFRAVTVSISM